MIQNPARQGDRYNYAIPGAWYSGGYIREVRYSGSHVMLFRVTPVGLEGSNLSGTRAICQDRSCLKRWQRLAEISTGRQSSSPPMIWGAILVAERSTET